MKKAKLPASSSSSGPTEKNGLHLDPAAAAARGAGRTNGEEDAEMLLADQDELRAPGASTPRGGTGPPSPPMTRSPPSPPSVGPASLFPPPVSVSVTLGAVLRDVAGDLRGHAFASR
jgi:hypothetical protein